MTTHGTNLAVTTLNYQNLVTSSQRQPLSPEAKYSALLRLEDYKPIGIVRMSLDLPNPTQMFNVVIHRDGSLTLRSVEQHDPPLGNLLMEGEVLFWFAYYPPSFDLLNLESAREIHDLALEHWHAGTLGRVD